MERGCIVLLSSLAQSLPDGADSRDDLLIRAQARVVSGLAPLIKFRAQQLLQIDAGALGQNRVVRIAETAFSGVRNPR